MSDDVASMNFVNFNQSGSCISVGTSQGFAIYNCDPFDKFYAQKKLFPQSNGKIDSDVVETDSTEDIKNGDGYAIVEMLFSTSLLAIVGIGDQPALSPRRLTMFNTKTCSIICEVTFPTAILSVKMNKTRLVVALQKQIYIYDISTMRLLHTIETNVNKSGLITVSSEAENSYLAYPSPPKIINSDIKSHLTTNNIVIPSNANEEQNYASASTTMEDNQHDDTETFQNLNGINDHDNINQEHNTIKNGDVILFDLATLQPTMVIEAHKGSISALALSFDGTLLATASEKGTIIRVFDVETGIKLYQFRRGTYPTTVHSISFSKDNRFISVASSSKTVHIFKMGKYQEKEPTVEEVRRNSASSNSRDTEDGANTGRDPYVDESRSTVGRMVRKSSQRISMEAVKKLGQIFPIKVSSILESSRHFASFKLPTEQSYMNAGNYTSGTSTAAKSPSENFISTGANNKSITSVGEEITIDIKDYPEVFARHYNLQSEQTELTMVPIRVVTLDGNYYNYVLDPMRGGDCILLSQYSILDS